MTRDELIAAISDLESKLKVREGRPGYTDNVTAINARLAELRESVAALNG